MYVTIPDPHPGRCLNFRAKLYGAGMKRCLDYENSRHVCSFEVEKQPRITHDHSSLIYTQEPPKPWVRPEDI